MWNIEKFSLTPGHSLDFKPDFSKGVLETALEVSRSMPDEQIMVWCECRVRTWIKNGVVFKETPNLASYYLIETKEDVINAICFANYLNNEDMETVARLEEMDMGSLMEMWEAGVGAPVALDDREVGRYIAPTSVFIS